MCRYFNLFLNSFKKFIKLFFCLNMVKINIYLVKKIIVIERIYILATSAVVIVLKIGII